MSKLQPGTYTTRRPLKVIWHIAAALVAAVALQLPFAASADAGPHRARLSSDLAAHLASGSTGDIDVIVSGSAEKIDRLARRHDLRIKKLLSSGAVFTVSRQVLDALSQDLEVETLSGNASGALAHGADDGGHGRGCGVGGRDRVARRGQRQRHRRRGDRQRHRDGSPGARRTASSPASTSPIAAAAARTSTATARTSPASSRRAPSTTPPTARIRAWRRPRT